MSESTVVAARVRKSVRGELGQLWGSVFFAAERTAPKTLLVTGAETGEGATQIAAGLAIVGAESNSELKLLLVDFNLRDPQLAHVLGVQTAAGLAEVVRGDTPIQDAVYATGIDNLALLPAGQQTDQPLALFRNPKLRTVLTDLAAAYDHLIIDAAAANRYPDAQILAGLVDGTILVTRTGVTRRETVAEAKKRIEQSRGRLLGIVLNRRQFPIPGFLYRRM